jgi:hypothetical protein
MPLLTCALHISGAISLKGGYGELHRLLSLYLGSKPSSPSTTNVNDTPGTEDSLGGADVGDSLR